MVQNTNVSPYLNEIAEKEIPYIFYNENDSIDALEEKLKEKNLSFLTLKDTYYIIIPNLLTDQLLRILWNNGINVEKHILLAKHPVISLKNFCGSYDDFFHNHIACYRQNVNIDLTGFAALAKVEAVTRKDSGMIAVNCNSQSSLYIGENTYTNVLSLGLLYSAAIHIHGNSLFSQNNIIRIGPFCSGEIGRYSVFGENIWVLIGDGHSIFDVHSGERINYLADDIKKLQFKIGDHVYIGDFTTIIGGCEIGENCYVEVGTILNKAFPPNSYVLGNPSYIDKTDIRWESWNRRDTDER